MTSTPARLRIALLAVAVAAAGGLTATIAHGDDPLATATFKTVDGLDAFQRVQGTGSSTSAAILIGGTVTFTNSSAESHSVDFGAPTQGGVSCQQTAGGTSPSALRFPTSPSAGSWAGVCTFTRAGTYSFMCDEHAGMTGTVVVTDPTAPPGTTTPTVPATTPVETTPSGSTPTTTVPATTPTGTTTLTTAQTPVLSARALSVSVKLAQRGSSVRGTISGARSSARATVALTARRGALGLAGKAATPVGIGRIGALTTTNGALAFTVKLDGKARAALARRRRLAVTVLVMAPAVTGRATPRTFSIVVKRAIPPIT